MAMGDKAGLPQNRCRGRLTFGGAIATISCIMVISCQGFIGVGKQKVGTQSSNTMNCFIHLICRAVSFCLPLPGLPVSSEQYCQVSDDDISV